MDVHDVADAEIVGGTGDARRGNGEADCRVVGMLAAGCMTTLDSEMDCSAKEWRLYPEGGPNAPTGCRMPATGLAALVA